MSTSTLISGLENKNGVVLELRTLKMFNLTIKIYIRIIRCHCCMVGQTLLSPFIFGFVFLY